MAFVSTAETYDLFSDPQKRLAREKAFLLRWAGNAERILELACGPGAHAHALATADIPGRMVLATDLSAPMVSKAAKTYQVHGLSYRVADMLSPPPGPFDRVYILGNSLNLLAEEAGVGNALRALKGVLAPGGSFLLQVLNPKAPGALESKQVIKSAQRDGVEVLAVKSLVPHVGRRTLTLSSFQRDASGNWESSSETAVLLDLEHTRLGELLSEAGYAGLEWFGGMDGSPLVESESADLVVVAKRA